MQAPGIDQITGIGIGGSLEDCVQKATSPVKRRMGQPVSKMSNEWMMTLKEKCWFRGGGAVPGEVDNCPLITQPRRGLECGRVETWRVWCLALAARVIVSRLEYLC